MAFLKREAKLGCKGASREHAGLYQVDWLVHGLREMDAMLMTWPRQPISIAAPLARTI
jgi:hypothetical protein